MLVWRIVRDAYESVPLLSIVYVHIFAHIGVVSIENAVMAAFAGVHPGEEFTASHARPRSALLLIEVHRFKVMPFRRAKWWRR